MLTHHLMSEALAYASDHTQPARARRVVRDMVAEALWLIDLAEALTAAGASNRAQRWLDASARVALELSAALLALREGADPDAVFCD